MFHHAGALVLVVLLLCVSQASRAGTPCDAPAGCTASCDRCGNHHESFAGPTWPRSQQSSGAIQSRLDRNKSGFFQLFESEAGWIGADDELRATEASTWLRVAIPLDGSADNILALQPGFRTFLLDGPDAVDVPRALYDAQLSILWRKTHTPTWQTNVWLQPSIRSDFDTSDDAFFFSGGAYVRYTTVPDVFHWYLGAIYLDRDDISVLPTVGFLWTPTPDWSYELLFPRPRIAYRLRRGNCEEKWAYLSGQLGGNTFAVHRPGFGDDRVTLRDLRVFVGLETVRAGGGGAFVEAGYVFDRGIEYQSDDSEFEFDAALMLRAGLRF